MVNGEKHSAHPPNQKPFELEPLARHKSPQKRFKRFETATVTIRGIELVEKIKKNQFNLIPLNDKIETAPDLWSAVLAA